MLYALDAHIAASLRQPRDPNVENNDAMRDGMHTRSVSPVRHVHIRGIMSIKRLEEEEEQISINAFDATALGTFRTKYQ